MGLASLASDSVPYTTFTPQEPLVEVLRVSLSKDAILVMSSQGQKNFLFTWLIKEWGWCIRREEASILLIVQKERQATLWRDLISRSTDLEPKPLDTCISNGLFVDTVEAFHSLLNTNSGVSEWMKISLMIIDNGHGLLSSPFGRRVVSGYSDLRHKSSRLVILTSGVLESTSKHLQHLDHRLRILDDQLRHIESFYNCQPEASSELLSILRFIANPRVTIVQYLTPKSSSAIEIEIEAVVSRCFDFLTSHVYSLFDTYGEEFMDLIAEIPDPTALPLKILQDFLYVSRTFGVWFAERAALVLLIQLDKLKTREKYERHFLLLSVLYTEMVRIRRLCNMAFEDMAEKDKIEQFSKPKILKLVEILKQYKPEHIQSGGYHKRAKNVTVTPQGDSIQHLTPHVRRSRGHYSSYDDPNSLCGVVFVQSKFASKLLYHFLKDLSRSEDTFSFLMPQYATSIDTTGTDIEDILDAETERRKQEEALRRFRMKECNILVSNSLLEFGIEGVKCNLVVAFDPPDDFHSYAQHKVKAKSQKASFYLILCDEERTPKLVDQLALYQVTEDRLKARCTLQGSKLKDVIQADLNDNLLPPFAPRPPKLSPDGTVMESRPSATLKSAIFYINRYCAKLPSDTFTRLTPLYHLAPVDGGFVCSLQLPINSPYKDVITGPVMPDIELSKRGCALEACKLLHQAKELDDYMVPIGKDGPKRDQEQKSTSASVVITAVQPKLEIVLEANNEPVVEGSNTSEAINTTAEAANDKTDNTSETAETKVEEIANVENAETINVESVATKIEEKADTKVATVDKSAEIRDTRPGTTKRRQYYYKQVADCLTVDRGNNYYLYSLQLKLTCPIPDDQNTRGRPIFDPISSSQCFGILVPEPLPPICEFPIYTRSGEVFVETVLLNDNVQLGAEEKELILTFHRFTFSKVLRLEKYPMTFSPDEADNKAIILPLRDGQEIDWSFIRTIESHKDTKLEPLSDDQRKGYVFDVEKYKDAVVMPWYRNQDQPQYFYVAEICTHLSPGSDFPGQGFETFEKYYLSKYKIAIQDLSQPLLDVDHTSARLNFLTPRYVNRKGVALPTSSEETKRNKRENLEQKQILVPELCTVHPFPASLWKHAVCLPCIMYRLNSLLIAEQLRAKVSREMNFGRSELASDHKWPSLTFGWTLSDVLKNRAVPEEEVPKPAPAKKSTDKRSTDFTREKSESSVSESASNSTTDKKGDSDDLGSLSSKLLDKLTEEESKLKKTSNLEIGTWSNEMAEEILNSGDPTDEEDDMEDELDWLDPNIALPDNLTFIDKTSLPKNDKGGRDWGTGIAQKTFRVGSPTFFSNPNINIPGMVDDLDGYSCTDSEDEEMVVEPVVEQEEEIVAGGLVRIAFRSGNTAEAIEDEAESNRRVETLAREKAEEEEMLENTPWEWNALDTQMSLSELFDQDVTRTKEAFLKSETFILDPQVVFCRVVVQTDEMPEGTNCSNSIDIIPKTVMDIEPFSHLGTMLKNASSSSTLETYTRHGGIIPLPNDPVLTFSFDEQPNLSNHTGPSPSLILQALTMSNSNDAINLERLETIGDSFLKYAITSFLYCVNESVHEGRLSHLRSKQVSNLNLYRLGRAKGLGLCMVATKFEPHDNWLPPCYHVPQELEKALIMSGVPSSQWNMADLPDIKQMDCEQICSLVREKSGFAGGTSSIETMPSFVPYNLLTQHSIPDKSIADCVEALIGAYLIACGPQGALIFMTWLGLTVLPEIETSSLVDCHLPVPSSPLLDPSAITKVDHLLDGYNTFEELIGYRFHDRSYLLQAFSHTSYYPNRFTDCYQRLEFLGDAVLDYLITRQLFEDPRLHSPGALTDLRSALVNNTIFASLAVKFQFHKFFKFFSPGLQTVINRFVKIQSENGYAVAEDFYLLDEDDSEEAEDIEVPKSLGDIFESVAGAIFLDSKLSLDAVWRVYYRMMKPEIDKYSENVPKSPIRELLELEPETAKFGKPEKLADGRRVRVSVEIFGKGVFKGIGRNYRIAKCTAAKCALRAMKKREKNNTYKN